MQRAKLALTAALLAAGANAAWARGADSPAAAIAVSSTDVSDPLDDADKLYSDAVARFQAGDQESGRS